MNRKNNKSTNFASGTKNWSIKKRRENIKDIKKYILYYMLLADDRNKVHGLYYIFFYRVE